MGTGVDRTDSCRGGFAVVIGKLLLAILRRQPERGQWVSCCCHSRHGVGLAPLWAALPRCVCVALMAEQSLPKEAFSTQCGYHLTVKSCHSILGVFKWCPGSAGCSKVEIKANLLLWLRRRLVTSVLILSEEIRDAPAGMGGQAQLPATLLG